MGWCGKSDVTREGGRVAVDVLKQDGRYSCHALIPDNGPTLYQGAVTGPFVDGRQTS